MIGKIVPIILVGESRMICCVRSKIRKSSYTLLTVCRGRKFFGGIHGKKDRFGLYTSGRVLCNYQRG